MYEAHIFHLIRSWRLGVPVLSLVLMTGVPSGVLGQDVEGPLVVFNAGSLAVPFQRLLAAFTQRNPKVRSSQEHSGSLAAVRKLTEFDRIPDVLAVADRTLVPRFLQPTYASWYATFARTAMVLAVAPRLERTVAATSQGTPISEQNPTRTPTTARSR